MKEIIELINSNPAFIAINVTIFIWNTGGLVVTLFFGNRKQINNQIQKTMKKFVKLITVIVGFILPVLVLYLSFKNWSGLWFWVSQALGWLTLINFFVFSKFLRIMKGMPDLKDLKK